VKWFAGVAIGYVVLMLVALGLIQYFARADHVLAAELHGPTGEYSLRIYRDVPIPAILGGRGIAPGEIEVRDAEGRVLDSDHVSNVDSVSEIRWEKYKVDFQHADGGATYQTSLDLGQ
jgi:hypothetical protein